MALSIIFIPSFSDACEPCAKTLSLEESIQKADLILLAENTPVRSAGKEGSAFITAKVLTVLKGEYPDSTIRLRSWYGTCSFAFMFTKPQELLLIRQDEKNDYTAIDNGCSVKELPYENGLIDGKYSVDEFKKRFLR